MHELRKPWIELHSQNQNDEDIVESLEPWNFDRLDINLKDENVEMLGDTMDRDYAIVGNLQVSIQDSQESM